MKNKIKLTKKKKLEESFDSGEWEEASDDVKKDILSAAQLNSSLRKREARVNIRLSKNDVLLIQKIAQQEGLGYQTLMSSIIHKYATGLLVEKKMLESLILEIGSKGLLKNK